jgi:hypothetical protein
MDSMVNTIRLAGIAQQSTVNGENNYFIFYFPYIFGKR